jgi:hypothetical protein
VYIDECEEDEDIVEVENMACLCKFSWLVLFALLAGLLWVCKGIYGTGYMKRCGACFTLWWY